VSAELTRVVGHGAVTDRTFAMVVVVRGEHDVPVPLSTTPFSPRNVWSSA
jgi:hypothetical protein